MLRIRPEQLEALRAIEGETKPMPRPARLLRRDLIDLGIIDRSVETRADGELDRAIEEQRLAAARHGITDDYLVLRYVGLTFRYGEAWHSDAGAESILAALDGDASERLQALHDYLYERSLPPASD